MKNKFATLRQAENLAEKSSRKGTFKWLQAELKTDIRIKKILMI